MPITTEDTLRWLQQVAIVLHENREFLTQLDSPIGDADHGINMDRGFQAVIDKLPTGNTLEVTRGVEKALDALRPALSGVEINSSIFRPAGFIEQAVDNLAATLLIGCLLVVLVLGAFLFQWRTALISVVAIPLSLVAAALVLQLGRFGAD